MKSLTDIINCLKNQLTTKEKDETYHEIHGYVHFLNGVLINISDSSFKTWDLNVDSEIVDYLEAQKYKFREMYKGNHAEYYVGKYIAADDVLRDFRRSREG